MRSDGVNKNVHWELQLSFWIFEIGFDMLIFRQLVFSNASPFGDNDARISKNGPRIRIWRHRNLPGGFMPAETLGTRTGQKNENSVLTNSLTYIAASHPAIGGWVHERPTAVVLGLIYCYLLLGVNPLIGSPNAIMVKVTVKLSFR